MKYATQHGIFEKERRRTARSPLFSGLSGGALGEIRTPDPRIRSPMLYPAELRALESFQWISRRPILALCRTENDRQKYLWLVSDTRLAQRRLGDPSLVLQLKLQFFNHLSKAFSREGICGLQGEPTSLLQFPLKCLAPHACHFRAPVFRTGSRKFSQTVSRFVNSALFNLTDAACYLFYFCS